MFSEFLSQTKMLLFSVAVPKNDVPCHEGNIFMVEGPVGYLSSAVTESRQIGLEECPWTIMVNPGQTIKLTLLDFSKTKTNSHLAQMCRVSIGCATEAYSRLDWDSQGTHISIVSYINCRKAKNDFFIIYALTSHQILRCKCSFSNFREIIQYMKIHM